MDAVDNVSLREAVVAFAADPGDEAYAKVRRELFQGALLIDATGSDIRMSPSGDMMKAGSIIRISGGNGPDGEPAFFAFTRQEEAQKLHPNEQAVTIGQPSDGVLQMAIDHGAKWLYIDAGGPTCGVATADFAQTVAAPHNLAVKAALNVADPAARRQAVREALLEGDGVLLVAVRQDGVGGYQMRVASGPDGKQRMMAFTSSLEVLARSKGSYEFVSHPVADVIANALDGTFDGLVINPAGPWIEIDGDELRQIQKSLPTADQ